MNFLIEDIAFHFSYKLESCNNIVVLNIYKIASYTVLIKSKSTSVTGRPGQNKKVIVVEQKSVGIYIVRIVFYVEIPK